MSQTFSWVADPYDPTIDVFLFQLLEYFRSDNVVLLASDIKPLDQSIKKYTYTVEDGEGTNWRPVLDLIHSISYQPIMISVTLDGEPGIDDFRIVRLSEIVKHVVASEMKTDIDTVNVVSRILNQKMIFQLYPQLYGGEMVYRPTKFHERIHALIDTGKLIEYTYISNSPLVVDLEIPDLEMIGNISITKNLSSRDRFDIEEEIRIRKLRGQMLFLEDGPLVLEFARAFELDIIRNDPVIIQTQLFSQRDIETNLQRLKNHRLPIVRINAIRRVDDRKIKLAMYLAYFDLANTYPYLWSDLDQLKWSNRGTIHLPCTTIGEVEKFEDRYQALISESEYWLFTPVVSFEYGLALKDKWQQQHPHLQFYVVETEVGVAVIGPYGGLKEMPVEVFTDLGQITRWIEKERQVPVDDGNLISLARARLLDLGLMGFFDLGPYRGLYRDPPIRQLTNPSIGQIFIDRSPEGGSRVVVVSRGDFIPLFSIDTIDQEIIDKLWNCGWFLDEWASAYLAHYGILSNTLSYPNRILASAAESSNSAASVRELLIKIYKQRCQ